MSFFIPSSYQQNIFDWFDTGTGNAAVDAVAGSGKSTTIARGLDRIPSSLQRDSLITAFGVDIVKALGDKVPQSVHKKGINALGYKAIRDAFPNRTIQQWKVEGWKYKEMAKGLQIDSSYGDRNAFIAGVAALLNFVQVTLTPIEDFAAIETLVYRFNLQIPPCGVEPLIHAVSLLLNRGIEMLEQDGNLSFGDQVWYPNYRNLDCDQYSLVCVDEAQDLSLAQMGIVAKSVSSDGRLIAVGDPKQAIYCQPAGTKVLIGERVEGGKHVTGYREVNIQDIKPGDTVVAYAREDHAFYKGKEVLKAGSRFYSGSLFRIKTLDKETECTDNHRWLVRWTERSFDLNVTYLMRKEDRYRIGWCQLFSKDTGGDYGNFHLGVRARIECADAVWILGVHRDKTSASIQESVIAARFGLPTIPFKAVNGAQHLTQDAIESFFDQIANLPMKDRAELCLRSFDRSIDWPFYEPDNAKRGRTTLFEVRACNLLGGLMKVPVWTGKTKDVDWEEITVDSEWVDYLKVYSLEVDKYHTYVANGIVTGNCFNGAENDSFFQLIDQFSMQRIPLSICYRCPKAVVAEAQRLVPQIEHAESAEEGVVDEIKYSQYDKMSKPGDMVLCRTTAPLVKECFRSIAARIPATIKGRDIAGGLTSVVEQVSKKSTWRDFDSGLSAYENHQIELLSRKPGTEQAIENLGDKIEAIRVCHRSFNASSARGFIADIESLFSDPVNGERKQQIIFSTVHRSKGLENPRIFIIYPEKLPLVWKNQSEAQLEQEKNLQYVAITRSQKELYFVETEKEG